MNVTDLGTALVRRRAAAIMVVVLAVIAGAYTWSHAKAQNQTSTTLLVTPPPFSAGAGDIVNPNPFLNINSNLAQIASALSTAMQSDKAASDLVQAGATGSFTVNNVTSANPNTASLTAQVTFVVTGDDADSTLNSANLIVTEARRELDLIQSDAKAPAISRATLTMLSAPSTPTLVKSTRLRAAGSIAAIVVLVGFVLIILIDTRMVIRATRLRHRPSPLPPTAQPHVEPSVEASVEASGEPIGAAATDAAIEPATEPETEASRRPMINGHLPAPAPQDPISVSDPAR